MFACEHDSVTPDLMCIAKGLTGGGCHGVDVAEQHNAAYIEEYAGVPVLGSVPWLGNNPDVKTIRQAVEGSVAVDRLVEHLIERLS